ncbi:hypothetical protein predicted by Glimmer/Critica [Sorangium cellulosum So ce56]|uniref:Uncharacterized protein n=1 Tax=Sorangium cellulosum (strain So ce56) TaxID=448385 RepID=A9ENM9_SORC5|nr:hypothetical protein [Sorangium cellulosum]CAN90878.1 hypothetical protein predicted by Glimmer/Critica [Sorangium cellulosum So ce56]
MPKAVSDATALVFAGHKTTTDLLGNPMRPSLKPPRGSSPGAPTGASTSGLAAVCTSVSVRPLARLQGRVALSVLTQRLPGLRLASDRPVQLRQVTMFRGPVSLDVAWDAKVQGSSA